MKWIRRLTRVEIVLIFLVIIAGSVVRMTGSGMGCPDWPKCFGYLIPPTERAQLEWQENQPYNKGQIIIVQESLRVAKQKFTSQSNFDSNNWEPYTKHDYAVFNPFHTWTEYINRLIGALAGIPMLLLVVLSARKVKKEPRLILLSLAGLFMLGFEAWLGKLVVDGNLIPGSISIHMFGALLIVALLLMLLHVASGFKSYQEVSKKVLPLLGVALILGLIQIGLGTQVREQVDYLGKEGVSRLDWSSQLNWKFYVHRSFSVLVVLVNFGIFYFAKVNPVLKKYAAGLLVIIGLEVLLGMVLYYFSFPKLAQPTHLLLACFMFGFHVYLLTKVWRARKTQSSAVSS